MVAARLGVVARARSPTGAASKIREDQLARSLAPDDLYSLRIPTDPRLSPDGSTALVTLQTCAPRHDGYRHAIWLVPLEGTAGPRQLTIGAKHDRHGRFSPDGRTVAFLSDRRFQVEEEPDRPKDTKEREDGNQIHLLSLDGGEARRLTDLPRGVETFGWSPDGRRLFVTTSSRGATRKEDRRARGLEAKPDPTAPPESDYRYIDRLNYMFNGSEFVYDSIAHIWIVDAETGEARRLTDGPSPDEDAVWSPDGTKIAFAARINRDHDLDYRSDIVVVDVETGRRTRITGGSQSIFLAPTWLPDGKTIAALGGRIPENAYRFDIWLLAADGSDAAPRGGRNISDRHDIMPGSSMNSDITPGEAARLVPSADGAWLTFLAPVDGANQLWRIAVSYTH
jgi:Tol biopolymer transport system component